MPGDLLWPPLWAPLLCVVVTVSIDPCHPGFSLLSLPLSDLHLPVATGKGILSVRTYRSQRGPYPYPHPASSPLLELRGHATNDIVARDRGASRIFQPARLFRKSEDRALPVKGNLLSAARDILRRFLVHEIGSLAASPWHGRCRAERPSRSSEGHLSCVLSQSPLMKRRISAARWV